VGEHEGHRGKTSGAGINNVVSALKRADCRERRFKDATINMMCPRPVAADGVEAVSARTPLVTLALLALLALAPAALAQEEVWAALDWTTDTVELPDGGSDASSGEPRESGVSVAGVTLLGPPPRRDPSPEEDSTPSDGSGSGGLFGLPGMMGPLPFDALVDVDGLLDSAPLALGLPDPLPEDADAASARAPVPYAAPQGSPSPSSLPGPPAAALPASPTLVALASAAAIASVAAAPAFDWERLRRFGFVAALYARIAKDRLLDHARRETLLSVVRDRPGLTLRDAAEASGIPRNTATYHLNRLEKEGIVTSARQGRSRLYFAVGGEARKSHADAFAALRHDKARALALAVGDAPGMDQQALCARLGLAPSLVHWHADRLLASGVLRKEREGRHVRYHPGAAYPLVAASEASSPDRPALRC
jgi:DNA-binding transcriptional ArsR family regulator